MKGLPTLVHCTTKGLLAFASFLRSPAQGLALPLPSFVHYHRKAEFPFPPLPRLQGHRSTSAPLQGRPAAAKARQCLLPPLQGRPPTIELREGRQRRRILYEPTSSANYHPIQRFSLCLLRLRLSAIRCQTFMLFFYW